MSGFLPTQFFMLPIFSSSLSSSRFFLKLKINLSIQSLPLKLLFLIKIFNLIYLNLICWSTCASLKVNESLFSHHYHHRLSFRMMGKCMRTASWQKYVNLSEGMEVSKTLRYKFNAACNMKIIARKWARNIGNWYFWVDNIKKVLYKGFRS